MEFNFKNKLILVTGSTKGIGFNIAQKFLNLGAKVIITGRNFDKKKKLSLKKNYFFYKVNFQDLNSIKAFLKKIKLNELIPDIIVNNIGGNLNLKDPLTDSKKWLEVMNLNFFSTVEINNFIIPFMKKKKWGRICQISSLSAIESHGHPAYSAAKAAVNAYVRGVGRYVSKYNIIMNAIMPGAILTKDGYWDRIKKKDKKHFNYFLKERMAIRRLGNEDEVSNLVLYLCSEYSSFSVGSSYLVDGGLGRGFQT
jgi:3-oxoacyl-[acyl-carrier protein] reductase